MRDALDRQLKAYHDLRPQILAREGSVWVLIANERLVKTFPDFGGAAIYAEEHFPNEQVLIRRTDEVRETVPFIVAAR